MSDEDYIKARPQYLMQERDFRKQIRVILERPANYDNHAGDHEEIWEDGVTAKWDGERELNLDEVPYVIHMDTKQIVDEGERASVIKTNLSHHSKYRQGTLVIISSFKKIWLIVIIFPKGGRGVAQKLVDDMCGTDETQVMWETNESGNMTAPLWVKVMNFLQNRTKTLRGCMRSNGMDWIKAIVLNVDNYGVHLERKLAHKYATFYGIFIRCLLRNASHIQQPVDQHIGQFIKTRIKNKLAQWIGSSNHFTSFGSNLKMDKQTWRKLTARFVLDAIREIESAENQHVLTLSWCNYGLYLPLDGSEDGNIDTLHKDSRRNTAEWKKRRTQELKNQVTIKTRTCGSITRVYQPLRVNYSMSKANINSRIRRENKRRSDERQLIPQDMTASNKPHLDKYMRDLSSDLTNTSNVFPDLLQIVTPFDVMALKAMYIKHGYENKIESLFVNDLCIPVRDERGRIMRMPRTKSVDEMKTAMDLDEEPEPAYKTRLVQEILTQV